MPALATVRPAATGVSEISFRTAAPISLNVDVLTPPLLGQQSIDDKALPRSIKAMPTIQFCMPAFELDPSKGLACSKARNSPLFTKLGNLRPFSKHPLGRNFSSLMECPTVQTLSGEHLLSHDQRKCVHRHEQHGLRLGSQPHGELCAE